MSMLLPSPPEIPAGNIEEILAAANALERAAAHRYRSLAQAMRRVGHDDVAGVFDDLAGEEELHVLSVEKLASTLLDRLPTEDIVRWVLPDTFGVEEAGPPASLTPYKALSIAVRSEERAFSFWTYVSANATAEPVRDLAESLAHHELLHAAKFRVARREAYRAERRLWRPATERPAQPLSLESLQPEAMRMAAESAAFLAAAAIRLDQLADQESADLVRQAALTLAHPTQTIPAISQDDIRLQAAERLQRAGPTAVLFEVEGVLERRVERYVDLLDRSPDAAVTSELERLAGEAMRLVARVNTRLVAVEPALSILARDRPKAQPSSD